MAAVVAAAAVVLAVRPVVVARMVAHDVVADVIAAAEAAGVLADNVLAHVLRTVVPAWAAGMVDRSWVGARASEVAVRGASARGPGPRHGAWEPQKLSPAII